MISFKYTNILESMSSSPHFHLMWHGELWESEFMVPPGVHSENCTPERKEHVSLLFVWHTFISSVICPLWESNKSLKYWYKLFYIQILNCKSNVMYFSQSLHHTTFLMMDVFLGSKKWLSLVPVLLSYVLEVCYVLTV